MAGKNYNPRKNSQHVYGQYRTPDWFRGLKAPLKWFKAKFSRQANVPPVSDKYGTEEKIPTK